MLFSQVEMSTKFVNGKVSDLNQASKVIRKVKGSESFVIYRQLPDSGKILQGSNYPYELGNPVSSKVGFPCKFREILLSTFDETGILGVIIDLVKMSFSLSDDKIQPILEF